MRNLVNYFNLFVVSNENMYLLTYESTQPITLRKKLKIKLKTIQSQKIGSFKNTLIRLTALRRNLINIAEQEYNLYPYTISIVHLVNIIK